MRNYKFLLFDLDDTLLDFKANEKSAVFSALKKHNISATDDMILAYHNINRALWDEFESGRISREQIWEQRFPRFTKVFGLNINCAKLELDYRNELGRHAAVLNGAVHVCSELCKSHELYIVTNGASEMQKSKLAVSGLDKFIRGMITSEDAGFPKPSAGFFDYAFSFIPSFEKSSALIIGDSLRADIFGGSRAGIDTCFFNPGLVKNTSGIIPTYEISSLLQLVDMSKK